MAFITVGSERLAAGLWLRFWCPLDGGTHLCPYPKVNHYAANTE